MSVFRNINNKTELARASAYEIQKFLTSASETALPEQYQAMMRSCVAAWTASFPRGTASAALGVLEEGIRRKREQTVESAGTDILTHQRLLTDFLQFTMRARQDLDATGRRWTSDNRLRSGARRERSGVR
jgi:hypothetical protein